jgi:hypothetical protein
MPSSGVSTTGGDGTEFPDDFVFDEDFVRAAPVRELTAADRDRLARRLAAQELAEAEDRQRRRQAVRDQRRARRPHRRLLAAARRPGRIKPLLLVAMFLGLVGWLWTTDEADSEIAFGGWEGSPATATQYDGALPRPTPRENEVTSPLGSPEPLPPGTGPYRFLATQPGSSEPVTYDPCRPIDIVVNPRTQPAWAGDLLDQALVEVTAATGLVFRIEGTTDEPPSDDRLPFLPDRYGDRWAPVLIAWSDPEEYPRVAGNVAGTGGSIWSESPDGAYTYVTGSVTLDGPGLQALFDLDEEIARKWGVTLLLHEIGHLVGLAHVDAPTQVMNEGGEDGTFEYGAGDLRGLRALGSGACVPAL